MLLRLSLQNLFLFKDKEKRESKYHVHGLSKNNIVCIECNLYLNFISLYLTIIIMN